MDLLTKLARGMAAARNAVGSEELGDAHVIQLESGGSLSCQPRRKRETGQRILRLETPLAEGLARIDLTPADARALALALETYADTAADDARPVAAQLAKP